MNAHPMITRLKRKNASSTTIVTIKEPNYYLYIVLGLLPPYAIAFYILVNNIGYIGILMGIYLFCGSFAYGSLMNQVNVQ
jgi:hypothetical protein